MVRTAPSLITRRGEKPTGKRGVLYEQNYEKFANCSGRGCHSRAGILRFMDR